MSTPAAAVVSCKPPALERARSANFSSTDASPLKRHGSRKVIPTGHSSSSSADGSTSFTSDSSAGKNAASCGSALPKAASPSDHAGIGHIVVEAHESDAADLLRDLAIDREEERKKADILVREKDARIAFLERDVLGLTAALRKVQAEKYDALEQKESEIVELSERNKVLGKELAQLRWKLIRSLAPPTAGDAVLAPASPLAPRSEGATPQPARTRRRRRVGSLRRFADAVGDAMSLSASTPHLPRMARQGSHDALNTSAGEAAGLVVGSPGSGAGLLAEGEPELPDVEEVLQAYADLERHYRRLRGERNRLQQRLIDRDNELLAAQRQFEELAMSRPTTTTAAASSGLASSAPAAATVGALSAAAIAVGAVPAGVAGAKSAAKKSASSVSSGSNSTGSSSSSTSTSTSTSASTGGGGSSKSTSAAKSSSSPVRRGMPVLAPSPSKRRIGNSATAAAVPAASQAAASAAGPAAAAEPSGDESALSGSEWLHSSRGVTARSADAASPGGQDSGDGARDRNADSNVDEARREPEPFPQESNVLQLSERYSLLRRLYLGADTVIYLAAPRAAPDTLCVLKIFDDDKYSSSRPPKAVQTAKLTPAHPCVLPLLDWHPLSESGCYAIAVPFVLDTPLAKAPEKIIKLYIVDLLRAIEHCHSHGVIHRDVKPGNVMFDFRRKRAVLIDFDVAIRYDPANPPRSFNGSQGYMAPEVESAARRAKGYDFKVDVYSAGVVLFEMLFAVPMEHRGRLKRQFIEYHFGQIKRRKSEHELLFAMLADDPATRMTVSEALAHPWLAKTVALPRDQTPYPAVTRAEYQAHKASLGSSTKARGGCAQS